MTNTRAIGMELAAALAACAAPGGVGEQSQAASSTIDADDLLIDAALAGGQSITAADVQSFLAAKGSALAGYSDPSFGQRQARRA